MLLRLLALVMLGLFAACGGTRHSLGRPANEVAAVQGSSADGYVLLGSEATIRIVSVDGQELDRSLWSGYPEVVEVLPGRRELEIQYTVYVPGAAASNGKAKLALDAFAGHTYTIQLGPEMQPTVVDATAAP